MNPLSRKNDTSKATLLFLLVLVASVGLVAAGKLTGAEWCGLLQWCLPAFVGSEAARTFAPKVSVGGSPRSPSKHSLMRRPNTTW